MDGNVGYLICYITDFDPKFDNLIVYNQISVSAGKKGFCCRDLFDRVKKINFILPSSYHVRIEAKSKYLLCRLCGTTFSFNIELPHQWKAGWMRRLNWSTPNLKGSQSGFEDASVILDSLILTSLLFKSMGSSPALSDILFDVARLLAL